MTPQVQTQERTRYLKRGPHAVRTGTRWTVYARSADGITRFWAGFDQEDAAERTVLALNAVGSIPNDVLRHIAEAGDTEPLRAAQQRERELVEMLTTCLPFVSRAALAYAENGRPPESYSLHQIDQANTISARVHTLLREQSLPAVGQEPSHSTHT